MQCPGPQSRRDFLKFGALTLGGLGAAGIVPWKLHADPTPGPSTSDTAVIFIWLPGGPPHMELYDLKPDAPSEWRGDFRPVRTNVVGMDVSEHLPMHTHIADKYTIIRSIMRTNFADHGGGHKRLSSPAAIRLPPSASSTIIRWSARWSTRCAANDPAASPTTSAASTAVAIRSTSSASGPRISARVGPSLHLRRRSDRADLQHVRNLRLRSRPSKR